MNGILTTHVLDLSSTQPADGILIELWRIHSENSCEFLHKAFTNMQGRLEEPILRGTNMKKGFYEFRFFVGDFYRKQGKTLEDLAFLECVPVRFGIADPQSHYHVPLLISPGGYSTYRGC